MNTYYNIPASTLQTIKDYIKQGYEPGDFVRAVLENDLARSFGSADEHNRAALFEIVKYIWNEIPANAWGSHEKVNEWIKRFKNENI